MLSDDVIKVILGYGCLPQVLRHPVEGIRQNANFVIASYRNMGVEVATSHFFGRFNYPLYGRGKKYRKEIGDNPTH
jgi:hypothetical protein